MRSNLIDITVEIEAETDKAVLVHEGDVSKAVWLPRSMIEIEKLANSRGLYEITLPERLAMEKGLI